MKDSRDSSIDRGDFKPKSDDNKAKLVPVKITTFEAEGKNPQRSSRVIEDEAGD